MRVESPAEHSPPVAADLVLVRAFELAATACALVTTSSYSEERNIW